MNLLNPIREFFSSTEFEEKRHMQEGLLSSLLVMAWMVEARDPYSRCLDDGCLAARQTFVVASPLRSGKPIH